jgi:hypothetical protein
LPTLWIDRDPDAPLRGIATVVIAFARLDQRLNVRAVEICAHHPHALAVAPIEFAARLLQVNLLWRERDALGDDDLAIAAIEVGTLNATVVEAGHPHVGPVNMAGLDIDHDAIRKMAVGDDDLPAGAVWTHRVNAATAQLKNEQSANRVLTA